MLLGQLTQKLWVLTGQLVWVLTGHKSTKYYTGLLFAVKNRISFSQWYRFSMALTAMAAYSAVGGYTACGIPLVWSANRNGNGIPFPLVSVKKIFASSVSVRFH